MISVSKTAPFPISVENDDLNFTPEVNILGLTLTRMGCLKYLEAKIRLAKGQLLKLRRFEHLNPSLIIRLYLTLVRSIIEYPSIPNGILAKNNLMKLQRLQNRALKLAVRRSDDRYMTLKYIHEKYNIQAINVRLDARFRKTWDKMEKINEDLYNDSIRTARESQRDYYWWPSVGTAYLPPHPPT